MSNQIIEEIKEFQKKWDEEKAILSAKFKDGFPTFFKEIFTKYPKLKAFRFTAYTPYFNDGDECIFRVGGAEEFLIEGYEKFDDYYSLGKENEEWLKEVRTEVNKIIHSVKNHFYQDAFGDHIEITVYSDKTNIEEYDHE
jgi:hypothetical protein